MITKKCKKCEKIIEGYSKRQVDYMMEQHLLKHKFETIKKEKKIQEKNEK